MKARHKRLLFVALGLVGVGAAAYLAVGALQSNIAYFYSPSQVLAKEPPADHTFRLGGLVETGTLQRQSDGLTLTFVVTDNAEKVKVSYTGILPDLFSEGRGVVTRAVSRARNSAGIIRVSAGPNLKARVPSQAPAAPP